MSSLRARLEYLEKVLARQLAPKVEVRWLDECKPCVEHPDCDIEVATGRHITGAIHLSWDPK